MPHHTHLHWLLEEVIRTHNNNPIQAEVNSHYHGYYGEYDGANIRYAHFEIEACLIRIILQQKYCPE